MDVDRATDTHGGKKEKSCFPVSTSSNVSGAVAPSLPPDLRSRFARTLPLWPVGLDGRCTCGITDCRRPGKHPDEHAPEGAGYAVVTGSVDNGGSGVFVLDVDVKSGVDGYAQLEALGVIPDTLTVRTGSGGAHFVFKHPGFHVHNRKPASAIDIKGDRQREDGLVYVVGPGSPGYLKTSDPCIVIAGDPYEVVSAVPIADAPEWLLAWLRVGESRKTGYAPTPITREHREWDRRNALAVDSCKTMPPSRADGEGGTRLFNLCLRLVREYELPLETAHALIVEHFNPRCTQSDGATPYPWSDDDIAHKLEDARDRSDKPTGMVPASAIDAITKRTKPIEAIDALKKRMADRTEPYVPPACTDTGNAELFVQLHGGDIRYVPKWKTWFVWDGQRWRADELANVMTRAKDVAAARWKHIDEYGGDAEDRLNLSKWAKQSESRRARENTLVLAQAESDVAIGHDAFDANGWRLNVENGTVDLRTGELGAHDRANLITKLAPIAYDPHATCPTWDAFLERVTGGNAAVASFLARAVGYSLTGDVGEQVLFFLQGAGANGKSTFTLVCRELLGDYAKQGAPDLLLAKYGEAHPTEQADLFAARFVLCQEVDQGRKWAEATLKQLTGSDRIKARRMGEDFWEFAPTHKLWVCANHRPQVRGTDEGIWRRIKLVPFGVTIPEEERDPHLVDKLRTEFAGILAWAVRGCLDWQKNGLGVPDEIRRATAAYREDEDRIGAFLAERCERGDGLSTKKGELYAAYQRWAVAVGEEAMTMREFGDHVSGAGFASAKSNGHRVWKGLRAKASAPQLRAAG